MQIAGFWTSPATTPVGMLAAGGASKLPAQLMYPLRVAPSGPAAPPLGAGGAMRRRTITIAAPQHWHCSLGRSLNAGCVDGRMPAGPGAVALGRSPMRNSASRWRCLQLGWSKPKLRERRNPLVKTCCSTNHKKCARLTVRSVFLPLALSTARPMATSASLPSTQAK